MKRNKKHPCVAITCDVKITKHRIKKKKKSAMNILRMETKIPTKKIPGYV